MAADVVVQRNRVGVLADGITAAGNGWGGIVVDGKPVEGVNSVGGEIGHVGLPYPRDDERPGPICSCGVAAHAEAWLSGPSLAADYARRAGIAVADGPKAPEVIDMAANGDAAAIETLARYEDRLGRVLSVVVNLLDPDVIVLGGGLSNVDRLYGTVPPLIEPHVFGDRFNTRLARNVHGDSSGVRGAAWL